MPTVSTRKLTPPVVPEPAATAQPSFWLHTALPLLAAAVLGALGIMNVNPSGALLSTMILAWLVWKAAPRRAALLGLACMLLASGIADAWMLPAVARYSGSSGPAIATYLISVLLISVPLGLQTALFAILRVKPGHRHAPWANALLFAALFVLFEWARAALFPAMPWVSYAVGTAYATNGLLIQPAALGGVEVLSFLLVLTAALFAAGIKYRNKVYALTGGGLLLLQLLGGLVLESAASGSASEKSVTLRVALLRPALEAEDIWDPSNANKLVHRLLDLNRRAAALKPDLTVWTEATVPWTYRADDDFIKEVLKGTGGASVHTLIGMSTDNAGGGRSSSAYLIAPGGRVLGRYDKQVLLGGVERPLPGGLVLPFQTAAAPVFDPGAATPIPTPWGTVGALLCNEATVPTEAGTRAAAGAQWLALMGNDSWFADTYVPRQQFYQCRLRAVENRKDMVFNCNQGYAGVIRASGEISARFNGTDPSVESATVLPRSGKPVSRLPFAIFIILTLIFSNRFFITLKTNPQTHQS